MVFEMAVQTKVGTRNPRFRELLLISGMINPNALMKLAHDDVFSWSALMCTKARAYERFTPGWTVPGEKRLGMLGHVSDMGLEVAAYFAEVSGRKYTVVPDILITRLGKSNGINMMGAVVMGKSGIFLDPRLANSPPDEIARTFVHESAHVARGMCVPGSPRHYGDPYRRFVGQALEEGMADFITFAFLSRGMEGRERKVTAAFASRYGTVSAWP